MAIPDYQACMLPLLRLAADGGNHMLKEVLPTLADQFGLTEAERNELLPSGQENVFRNRVSWANTYLKKAGLLRSERRGYFSITERGKDVLLQHPKSIDVKFLAQFPEFQAFKGASKGESRLEEVPTLESAVTQTPLELLETAYAKIRSELTADVLDRIKAESASLFERVVVELLLRMGYGGSRSDAGQAIGKSGDEGLDGVIKEDRLGLEIIYLQAKRWTATVGRPEIQKFAGALHGQHANKGIFITTSDFSREAHEYVARIGSKIVLIDGPTLAQLMIDFGVGVTTEKIYEVKRVDSDFFESI
jgi:restriction system protein